MQTSHNNTNNNANNDPTSPNSIGKEAHNTHTRRGQVSHTFEASQASDVSQDYNYLDSTIGDQRASTSIEAAAINAPDGGIAAIGGIGGIGGIYGRSHGKAHGVAFSLDIQNVKKQKKTRNLAMHINTNNTHNNNNNTNTIATTHNTSTHVHNTNNGNNTANNGNSNTSNEGGAGGTGGTGVGVRGSIDISESDIMEGDIIYTSDNPVTVKNTVTTPNMPVTTAHGLKVSSMARSSQSPQNNHDFRRYSMNGSTQYNYNLDPKLNRLSQLSQMSQSSLQSNRSIANTHTTNNNNNRDHFSSAGGYGMHTSNLNQMSIHSVNQMSAMNEELIRNKYQRQILWTALFVAAILVLHTLSIVYILFIQPNYGSSNNSNSNNNGSSNNSDNIGNNVMIADYDSGWVSLPTDFNDSTVIIHNLGTQQFTLMQQMYAANEDGSGKIMFQKINGNIFYPFGVTSSGMEQYGAPILTVSNDEIEIGVGANGGPYLNGFGVNEGQSYKYVRVLLWT